MKNIYRLLQKNFEKKLIIKKVNITGTELIIHKKNY